jgi:hypothetical protein
MFVSACLPLIAVQGLAAQDPPRPVQVGLALNLATPVGELKNDLGSQLSLGASLILPIQWRRQWVIRPRLDLTGWSGTDRRHVGGDYRENVDAQAYGIGSDLLFFPMGDTARGLYLGAGLGIDRWRLTYKAADNPDGLPTHASETRTNLTSTTCSASVGYQFSRTFGLEFRAKTSQYEALDRTVTAGALAGGTRKDRSGTSCQVSATFSW